MKTLQLEEQESRELVEYYTRELAKIEERRNTIHNLLSQLNSFIENSDRSVASMINNNRDVITEPRTPSKDSYNPKWTWTEKITYILKIKSRALTKKEILNELFRVDQELFADKTLTQRSVGATLSRQTKNDVYKLHENSGTKYNAYALPEWFEDGEIKIEYS